MSATLNIRGSGRPISRRRQHRRDKRLQSLPPLKVYGIPVPADVVASGHCVAYVCRLAGEHDPDSPRCRQCGVERELYHETCGCGGRKPWLFRDELIAERFSLRAQAKARHTHAG